MTKTFEEFHLSATELMANSYKLELFSLSGEILHGLFYVTKRGIPETWTDEQWRDALNFTREDMQKRGAVKI